MEKVGDGHVEGNETSGNPADVGAKGLIVSEKSFSCWLRNRNYIRKFK